MTELPPSVKKANLSQRAKIVSKLQQEKMEEFFNAQKHSTLQGENAMTGPLFISRTCSGVVVGEITLKEAREKQQQLVEVKQSKANLQKNLKQEQKSKHANEIT